MFKVPFYVRLADPGMSFHDPVSRISLSGTDVKEVTALTPHTESWLRGGGLIKVDVEDEPEDQKLLTGLIPNTLLKSDPNAEGKEEDEEEDAKDTEEGETNLETSTQEEAQAPSGISPAPEDEKGAQSLEDLLKNSGSGEDDDDDAPATVNQPKSSGKHNKR